MKFKKVVLFTILAFFPLFYTCEIAYSGQNRIATVPVKEQKGILVTCKMSHVISVPGKTPWVMITALIPQSVPNIQKINRVEYSVEPVRFFSRNGLNYADIIINNPGRTEKLEITVFAELYRYDLETAMDNKEKNRLQETGLDEFLKEEKYLEKNNSKIREAVRGIKGASEIEIVRNIYNYVLDNMEYVKQGKKDRGALYALRHKKGDCSEYSDLFVTLCRARKIPARVVTGISVQSDTKTARHNWAEAYLDNYGWVPFDPSKGDVKGTFLRGRLFYSLEPSYIYFTNIRNDVTLKNYHYCLITYFGDQVKISDSIKFDFPKESN